MRPGCSRSWTSNRSLATYYGNYHGLLCALNGVENGEVYLGCLLSCPLHKRGNRGPMRGSDLSESPAGKWTDDRNPAPPPALLPQVAWTLGSSARLPGTAPHTAPSPSSLASSFAWARRSQASGARSSRGRIAGSGYDPPALRLKLNWKLRDWAGGRCHALGPPQGRCRALLRPPRGRVFSLRRSGPPDVGQVIVVPGSCRRPVHALPTLSPSLSKGCNATQRKKWARRTRV